MAVLDEHIKSCDECRTFLQDVVPLKAHVAPIIAAGHARTYEPPEGIRQRFLQRAGEAGIILNPGPALECSENISRVETVSSSSLRHFGRWFTNRLRLPLRLALPIAASLLCAVLGYWIALQRVGVASPAINVIRANAVPAASAVSASDAGELAKVERENSVSRVEIARITIALATAEKEKQELTQRLAASSQDAARGAEFEGQLKSVRAQLQLAEERIDRLNSDLSDERSRAATANALLDEQQRVAVEASQKVLTLQAQLEQFRGLGTETEKDTAGELISARNLHIVDVYDTATNGGPKKAFGRVFYVEGKSLVFYAYDLPMTANNRKIEFRVWGEHAGVKSVSLSLGAMQSDAPAQGRWLLTCSDRRVLSKINAVYITREQIERPSPQPQGEKLMYAFLGEPNHP
jgi:hypothetical protein